VSSHLPSRRESLMGALVPAIEDRAAIRRHAAIQRAAFVQRACDAAERELTRGRVSDIGDVTHHAMDEGGAVVEDLDQRIRRNPINQALAGFAEEGLDAMRLQLRHLGRGVR